MLTERAAGAALRYAKRLPHAIDALPAARRAQKFPRAASVRIILSSVRSDTPLVQINLGALLSSEAAHQSIHVTFDIPFQKRQNGRARPIVIAPPDAPQPDQDLINLVADAKGSSVELLDGTSSTFREIEDREGLQIGCVSGILPLAWLASDISTAILEGRQPALLTAKVLRDFPDLPLD